MTGDELAGALELHPRATWDFLDALVALGFLDRDGEGKEARYRNTAETALFLDKKSERYKGVILEMFNARSYRLWDDLTEALTTGKPASAIEHTGRPIFDRLYRDPAMREQFMNVMTGISLGNFQDLAEKFDFSKYRTLCDVGGATGQLSVLVATRHPHLRCTSFDLPVIESIARKTIEGAGLSHRIATASGDFFEDPLPGADVITMSMILHDWNLDRKMQLIKAAYKALSPGGAFVIIEHLIDDARCKNVFGLMMSLNMLIEVGDGFDFTASDFARWCGEVGFRDVEVLALDGPASAAVAYK
jgi:SAM-dependent methyltransferase